MTDKVWSIDRINQLKPGEHFPDEIILYAQPQKVTFEKNSIIKCKTMDGKTVVCRFEIDSQTSGLKELKENDLVAIKNALIGDCSSKNYSGPKDAERYLAIVEDTSIHELFQQK